MRPLDLEQLRKRADAAAAAVYERVAPSFYEQLKDPYFLSGGNADEGLNYCYDCCDAAAECARRADPEADIYVMSGSGGEYDTPPVCDTCEETLHGALTEYGALAEADHFLTYPRQIECDIGDARTANELGDCLSGLSDHFSSRRGKSADDCISAYEARQIRSYARLVAKVETVLDPRLNWRSRLAALPSDPALQL